VGSGTTDLLGIGAIVSLLPIGFLLRMAFWLGIVVLVLFSAPRSYEPSDTVQFGGKTHQPSNARSAHGAISAATSPQQTSQDTLTAQDRAALWRGSAGNRRPQPADEGARTPGNRRGRPF
jgi:hypothetical protein